MAKKQWIRLYTTCIDNPKVQMLDDAAFRFWSNCLCIAGNNEGFLPDDDVLAFQCRLPRNAIETLRETLMKRGLVDLDGSGHAVMHDWYEHQYETDSKSTDRVRAFRERRMKHNGNVSETVSETLLKQNSSVSVSVSASEEYKNRNKNLERARDYKPGVVASSFRQFWDRWCELTQRKQRESYACQAWISVVELETEAGALACLERYGSSEEVKRGIVTNPDKWIYDQARDGFRGEWQRVDPTPNRMVEKRTEVLKLTKIFEGMR